MSARRATSDCTGRPLRVWVSARHAAQHGTARGPGRAVPADMNWHSNKRYSIPDPYPILSIALSPRSKPAAAAAAAAPARVRSHAATSSLHQPSRPPPPPPPSILLSAVPARAAASPPAPPTSPPCGLRATPISLFCFGFGVKAKLYAAVAGRQYPNPNPTARRR